MQKSKKQSQKWHSVTAVATKLANFMPETHANDQPELQVTGVSRVLQIPDYRK
jgi:hypothetical protein